MGAAFATKFARYRAFEIGTREFARFAARVTKALRRHEHEHVRRAAADILAFAAMALRLRRLPRSEFYGNSIRLRISRLKPPKTVNLARRRRRATRILKARRTD